MGNGWIDDGNFPSDDLRKLVHSYREELWRSTLKEVLPKAYAFIPGNWEQITPKELHSAFVSRIGQELPVAKSCERFFLSAAAEAGYNLPSEFSFRTAHLRPVTVSELPPPENLITLPAKIGAPKLQLGTFPVAPATTKKKIWEQLLDLVDDPDMPDAVKAAAFTLISYFKQRERHAGR